MRYVFLLIAAMGLTTLSAQTDIQSTSVVTAADSITSGTKVAEQPSVPTLDPGTLCRKPTESEPMTEEVKGDDALISAFPTEPGSIPVIASSAIYEEVSYDATPRPLQQIQSDQPAATSAIYNLLGCRVANSRFRIVNGRLVFYR